MRSGALFNDRLAGRRFASRGTRLSRHDDPRVHPWRVRHQHRSPASRPRRRPSPPRPLVLGGGSPSRRDGAVDRELALLRPLRALGAGGVRARAHRLGRVRDAHGRLRPRALPGAGTRRVAGRGRDEPSGARRTSVLHAEDGGRATSSIGASASASRRVRTCSWSGSTRRPTCTAERAESSGLVRRRGVASGDCVLDASD